MKPFVPKQNLEWFKKFVKTNTESVNEQKNVYWSSESSLNSNGSDAESILSQLVSNYFILAFHSLILSLFLSYFGEKPGKHKETKTTGTTM